MILTAESARKYALHNSEKGKQKAFKKAQKCMVQNELKQIESLVLTAAQNGKQSCSYKPFSTTAQLPDMEQFRSIYGEDTREQLIKSATLALEKELTRRHFTVSNDTISW